MQISKIKIHNDNNKDDYIIDLKKKNMSYELYKQVMPLSIMTYAHGMHLIGNGITVMFNTQRSMLITFKNEASYNNVEIKLMHQKEYIKFSDFIALVKMSTTCKSSLPFNDDTKEYTVNNKSGKIESTITVITIPSPLYNNEYICRGLEIQLAHAYWI